MNAESQLYNFLYNFTNTICRHYGNDARGPPLRYSVASSVESKPSELVSGSFANGPMMDCERSGFEATDTSSSSGSSVLSSIGSKDISTGIGRGGKVKLATGEGCAVS